MWRTATPGAGAIHSINGGQQLAVAWKLCAAMRAGDVTEKAGALAASGCDTAKVLHRPRLLSENGASCVAGDLARWLGDKGIAHIRGAPNHPQTQGKSERWRQTLKNRVLLETTSFPASSRPRSEPSSTTTTTAATTRASAT
jgi:transposase InsO family protein